MGPPFFLWVPRARDFEQLTFCFIYCARVRISHIGYLSLMFQWLGGLGGLGGLGLLVGLFIVDRLSFCYFNLWFVDWLFLVRFSDIFSVRELL